MKKSMSKRWGSWRTPIGASALAAAAMGLAGVVLACGPNQIVVHHCDCPDAGASDGGDAGDNGVGYHDPVCDYSCANPEE